MSDSDGKEVVVTGRILQWGNSLGVRLPRADLLRAGLGPGAEVTVRVAQRPGRIDLSGLPVFRGGRPDDSERHDELLAEALERKLRRKSAAFWKKQTRKQARGRRKRGGPRS